MPIDLKEKWTKLGRQCSVSKMETVNNKKEIIIKNSPTPCPPKHLELKGKILEMRNSVQGFKTRFEQETKEAMNFKIGQWKLPTLWNTM